MTKRITLISLAALGAAAALHGSPAAAQARAASQDVQIYAGEIFGDRLTDSPLDGRHPLLDDGATFGGRYGYNFTDQWGTQLEAGYTPGRASRVPGGNVDLGLTTVDLDVVWSITPGYRLGGHPLMPYTEAGVGYAWAHLDRALDGAIGATPATLTDSNGYTANAGVGAKYYLTSNFFVDFDARYRYLSRLVNRDGRGLNTGETTLSVGYRF